MEDFSWTNLAIQVAMGFSLAAVAGFRAFLPLLAAGGASRLGLIPLADAFSWLQSDEALLILAVATLLEFLGDKIPVIDHALDTVGILVKPAAGWLVAAAPLLELDTQWATVLALLTGSAVAGGIHLTRASLRVASTVTTGGLANPLLSFAEDVLGILTAAVAIFLPALAFFLICAGLAGLWLLWRRHRPSRMSPTMPRVRRNFLG